MWASPIPGMLQGVGVRGPKRACLLLFPVGISTAGGSSAASGIEGVGLRPGCGPVLN